MSYDTLRLVGSRAGSPLVLLGVEGLRRWRHVHDVILALLLPLLIGLLDLLGVVLEALDEVKPLLLMALIVSCLVCGFPLLTLSVLS